MIERRRNVQRILLDQINASGIEYKYFISIDYHYKQKDYDRVMEDNRFLRRKLRTFFKADLHMITVIEKHRKETSKNRGGYHRHMMLEKIPDECWTDPSNSMMTFMLKLNDEAAIGMRMGKHPPKEIKEQFISKVCRDLNRSIPNGYRGTRTEEIEDYKGGIKGLIEYLTKDVDIDHPAYEVIDPSSDIDFTPIMDLYNDNKAGSRSQIIFA